jgi:hypothetical protein
MRQILLVFSTVIALGSSFGAPIPISELPFNITAPGTYVCTSNLSYTGTGTAITITVSPSLSAPVTLNLRGYTLTQAAAIALVSVLVEARQTRQYYCRKRYHTELRLWSLARKRIDPDRYNSR